MKKTSLIITALLLPLVSACSNQAVRQQDTRPKAVDQDVAAEEEDSGVALPAPDLFRIKDGKTLKLVKIMEGGACRNESEGVVGMFMLYTDPEDIERIKQDRGNGVFADYEQVIEEFAMLALQQAVDELDFSEDPFALDEEDNQQKLAAKLAQLFDASVSGAVIEFEQETTLTIDLVPMQNSLYFYLDGCELPHED